MPYIFHRFWPAQAIPLAIHILVGQHETCLSLKGRIRAHYNIAGIFYVLYQSKLI